MKVSTLHVLVCVFSIVPMLMEMNLAYESPHFSFNQKFVDYSLKVATHTNQMYN